MQVPERDRPFLDAFEEALQERLVRVGPNVLVVSLRISVNHEQAGGAAADVQRERKFEEKSRPLRTELFALPGELGEILSAFIERRDVTDVTIGIPAQTRRADALQALEHLARTRPIQAQIPGRNAHVGTALLGKIAQTRVETAEVSVNVRKDRDAH
jgi:hypothetical protein